ncbi:MAG TPA: hypothetical protein VMM13_07410 [Euzebya sp.]|nr:hypothetical protein [Euzebya sp.]
MKKPPPNANTWTAVCLIALGLILIYLGWNGTAGADAARDLRAQFPYLISGGIFGLALIGSGLTLVRVYEARRDSKEVVAHLQRLTEAVGRLASAQVHQAPTDAAIHGLAYPPAGAVRQRERPTPVGVGAGPALPAPPFERGR